MNTDRKLCTQRLCTQAYKILFIHNFSKTTDIPLKTGTRALLILLVPIPILFLQQLFSYSSFCSVVYENNNFGFRLIPVLNGFSNIQNWNIKKVHGFSLIESIFIIWTKFVIMVNTFWLIINLGTFIFKKSYLLVNNSYI